MRSHEYWMSGVGLYTRFDIQPAHKRAAIQQVNSSVRFIVGNNRQFFYLFVGQHVCCNVFCGNHTCIIACAQAIEWNFPQRERAFLLHTHTHTRPHTRANIQCAITGPRFMGPCPDNYTASALQSRMMFVFARECILSLFACLAVLWPVVPYRWANQNMFLNDMFVCVFLAHSLKLIMWPSVRM